MFSPSPDVILGVTARAQQCPALPGQGSLLSCRVPGGAARQIRKFCEAFIVYSESVFCSVEADCSSGQFQVLTAGPPSPSSPPLPVWDERGEV